MLAPFTEAEADSLFGGLCVEALLGYDEAAARVRRDSRIEFEYSRAGSVDVALDVEEAARFRALEAALRERGVASTWRDAGATAVAHPSLTPSALGSLEIAGHGFIAAMPFARALADAGRTYGLELLEGSRVARVRRFGRHLEVETDRGPLESDYVVVCTGSWSGRLTIDGAEPLPVRPVRGQLLELRPSAPIGSRILWGPRCYLVPWESGTVLVGATVEEAGFDERATAGGVASLLASCVELVPALGDAGFVEVRVGLRPASADGLPIIGPAPDLPGIVYATGHFRNGVLLAPLTATIVADLLLQGRRHPALDALSPERFAARARP
jgi:glycine oxidase